MVDHCFFFSFPFPKSAERFADNIQLMYVAFPKSAEGFLGVMIHWLLFMNPGTKHDEQEPGLFLLDPKIRVHAYCLIGRQKMYILILAHLCCGELLLGLM